MEATQINYRRDEALKTVDQKLQELSETSAIDTDIAPVFKSTNTYAPGDMVYYRNKLYVFNVEHTGAWAAADVTATDVTTQMSSLKSGLTNYENQNNLNLEVANRKNVAGLSSFTNENNITFTADNSTGTVSASGSTLYSGWAAGACFTKQLPAGKYIVSCATNPNDLNVLIGMTSQGVITTAGIEITVNAGDTVRLAWSLTASESISYTATGIMIRPSFITDPTFAPYIPSVDARLEAVESGLDDVQSDLTKVVTALDDIILVQNFRGNGASNTITINKFPTSWKLGALITSTGIFPFYARSGDGIQVSNSVALTVTNNGNAYTFECTGSYYTTCIFVFTWDYR
jgi:hypothetical protein